MGSLGGHVLPGSFFIAFSLWWIYSIFQRYYRSRYFREQKYYSSASFPASFRGRNLPLEGILKIVAVTVGIAGETITAFKDGHWAHLGNAQHISMFFFFGLTGVMDVLYFYKFALPPNLDYATAIVAFIVEGLLFAFHLHGRTMMDVQVHILLLYVVIFCGLATLLELLYRSSVVAALARSYFTLLQGTWFYQVGFILYPPAGMEKWEEDNHDQMMVVTTIFSWHFALGLVVILVTNFLVSAQVRRMYSGAEYQRVAMSPLRKDDQSSSLIVNGENGKCVSKDAMDTSEEDV